MCLVRTELTIILPHMSQQLPSGLKGSEHAGFLQFTWLHMVSANCSLKQKLQVDKKGQWNDMSLPEQIVDMVLMVTHVTFVIDAWN